MVRGDTAADVEHQIEAPDVRHWRRRDTRQQLDLSEHRRIEHQPRAEQVAPAGAQGARSRARGGSGSGAIVSALYGRRRGPGCALI